MSTHRSSSSDSTDVGERCRDHEDQDGNDARNIFHRRQEERELGPPERADDAFGSTEKPKKMRESRQVVATSTSQSHKRRPEAYLIINIPDDEESDQKSVENASQSPEIVHNRIKNETILEQVMNEIMGQSISHPSTPSDHPETDPLCLENDPQSHGSEDIIDNDTMMNRITIDVINQSFLFPRGMPGSPETATNSENDRINDRILNGMMDQSPEASEAPTDESQSQESGEDIEKGSIMNQVMKDVMSRSFTSFCQASMTSDHEESPLSPEFYDVKLRSESRLDHLMTEVMDHSDISQPSMTPDHREISPPLPKEEPPTINQVMPDDVNLPSVKKESSPSSFEFLTSNDEESPQNSPNPDSRVLNPFATQVKSHWSSMFKPSVIADHQENEENQKMPTRVMPEVMNQPLIKTESVPPGDLSDITTELPSPRPQDSPHLEDDDLDDLESSSQLTTSSYLDSLIDAALDGESSQGSSDESRSSSSGSCPTLSDRSEKLHRLIDRALEGRVSSASDVSEVPSDDEGDSDDEDDECSAHVKPGRSNGGEERTVNERQRKCDDYYYKKHYTPEENQMMIDVLIRDDRIMRGSTLKYWRKIANRKLSGLKGRSARSLHNHFKKYLLVKKYEIYTRDPLALAQFGALYRAGGGC